MILLRHLFALTLFALPAVDDDPAALARQILDDAKPSAERDAIVRAHPELSDRLIAAMAADLQPGTPEEYRRIPWIWRVAIAAGKRNDAAEMKRILDASLPALDRPLDDWRAVVVGGGIINGITQAGAWPDERLDAIVKSDKDLDARYRRAIGLASAMADDPKVKTGTRYDALRMLGVEPFARRAAQLVGYLAKDQNAELQMGAVSGLGDVRDAPQDVARHLIGALSYLNKTNRELALDALVRDDARASALLDAVAAGTVKRDDLGEKRIKKLTESPTPTIRERAEKVLGPR